MTDNGFDGPSFVDRKTYTKSDWDTAETPNAQAPTHLAYVKPENIMITRGNVYGPTYISDQARVIVGNVYIGYPYPNRRPFALSPFPVDSQDYRTFDVTTKTTRCEVQYSVLPWLLTMTRDTTTRKSAHAVEKSFLWRLVIFGKYMVRLGASTEANGDLRLYRPRLCNVVSEDSDLMVACKLGDLSTIRFLLSNRMASPHDVTKNDNSPLSFAIDGGHEHAVQELLTFGADANQSFEPKQISPLAWALRKRNSFMVRLLMYHGACLHHISRKGWSLLFYLWTTETDLKPSCLEFLQILCTADSELFTSLRSYEVDDDGWVLFNRAACAGTPDELDFLIEHGADVYFKNEYDWNALFDAVFGGKLGNVQKLIPYFPDFLELRDIRGWTLLHVAAEEGHDDIVRYLLSQGADWQAKSWPSYTEVHETLRGIPCTPLEAARAWNEDHARRFANIVEEMLDETP